MPKDAAYELLLDRSVQFGDRVIGITRSALCGLLQDEISNRGRKLPAEAIEFRAFLKTYMARFVSQKFTTFLAKPNREDLILMRDLMTTGKVTPVIDKCHRLSEVPKAIRYLEEKHARGKVVLSLR